ncbi:MAG: flavodoxin-dependent (E)-4-hydroxy-3-methylbut-2-enyl-diphosphate synthase [Brevinematales bacterium]|nr:flavodoxin-dependent (E)-4-hydroxy-3-methylbut-2-enyl-diphosphate synthase [Brevinematales bacterium]
MIERRKSRRVRVGDKYIGGDAPVTVQTMPTSKTTNIKETVDIIKKCEEAGVDIVRLGMPDIESARAIKEIKKHVKVPIVADIHFDYKIALEAIKSGADKIRLNPGNIKEKWKVEEVVRACKDNGIPIRIGVNAGSIDRTKYPKPTAEALVDSAFRHVRILEDLGFYDIVISVKHNDVITMVEAYRLIAKQCDYPLHLGVTEAGTEFRSTIKSTIGIGTLLMEGIGDTIRVSLTGDSAKEVEIGIAILQQFGYKPTYVDVVSCPLCARADVNIIELTNKFEEKVKNLRKKVKVAIMGCVVNGPGESMDADIGVSCGKSGSVAYKNGKIYKRLNNDEILDFLLEEVNKFNPTH